jgi:hypothetical protein
MEMQLEKLWHGHNFVLLTYAFWPNSDASCNYNDHSSISSRHLLSLPVASCRSSCWGASLSKAVEIEPPNRGEGYSEHANAPFRRQYQLPDESFLRPIAGFHWLLLLHELVESSLS